MFGRMWINFLLDPPEFDAELTVESAKNVGIASVGAPNANAKSFP